MTRSDVGTILITYLVCLLFYYMTLELPPAAQIYPACLVLGLALLDTLYLGRCLFRLYRERQLSWAGIVNDLPEVFKGFQKQQFFFVVAACIGYMGLLYYLGFYLAGLIFLVGVLLYLKVKPLPIAITTVFLGALIYCVFTLFLKVPLPKGILFG